MAESIATMSCREGCGACCIAPSINEPFYGMPEGKKPGEACIHLGQDMGCQLFGDARRPALCAAFVAEPAVCGDDRAQALAIIGRMEIDSAPGYLM